MNAQELFQQAKSELSPEEKTTLALNLIDDAGSQIEVAQLLESLRRMEDLESGRVQPLDHNEAFALIRQKLATRQTG